MRLCCRIMLGFDWTQVRRRRMHRDNEDGDARLEGGRLIHRSDARLRAANAGNLGGVFSRAAGLARDGLAHNAALLVRGRLEVISAAGIEAVGDGLKLEGVLEAGLRAIGTLDGGLARLLC